MKKSLLWFLVITLIVSFVAVLSLAGCKEEAAPAEEEVAEEAAPVEEEEQVEIFLQVIGGPSIWAVQAIMPLVEQRNPDIKVTVEEVAWTDIYQKELLEFSAKTPGHDIVMQSNSFFGVFAASGFLEPLNEYFENEDLIDINEYDIADFNEDVLNNVASYNGKLYAVPFMYFPQILAYRSDLFEQEGLEVPKTFDQLLEVVKILDKIDGIDGTMIRGLKGGAGANVYAFAPYLYGFGGDYVQDGKLALNSPEAVKALDFFAELAKYAPSETINAGADEVTGSFAGGQVGIIDIDADEAAGLLDPEYTEYVDVIGMDTLPAGEFTIVQGQGIPHLGAWSMGISAFSEHKNEAFRILTDILSNDADITAEYVKYGVHPRMSVLNKYKDTWANYEVVFKELPGTKSIPVINNWPEIEEIIATAISKKLIGEMDSKEALDEAQEQASAYFQE